MPDVPVGTPSLGSLESMGPKELTTVLVQMEYTSDTLAKSISRRERALRKANAQRTTLNMRIAHARALLVARLLDQEHARG